jgi:hypothetical protein
MSTISQVAGTMRPGCTSSASFVSRSSGTVITPTLGSIVQKGKLAACALALDRQLNSVDFPTLGSPTIPHFNDIFIDFRFTDFRFDVIPFFRLQSYKEITEPPSDSVIFLLLFCREVVLAYAADGAYPVFGDVFEGGAGGDAVVGVAHFRVIHVTTGVANVLFHTFF